MNTRKVFLLLALAFTGALNCTAQLNGTGFYRFRNAQQANDYTYLQVEGDDVVGRQIVEGDGRGLYLVSIL